MNPFCRVLISFLLLFIFAAKLSLPVYIDHKNIFITDTEQQSEKSSEKDTSEKSPTNSNTEVADMQHVDYTLSFIIPGSSVYRSIHNHHPVLQFCAVPTPPPWFKS